MKNTLLNVLACMGLLIALVGAKPPTVAKLKEDEIIQVNVDTFANAVTHYQYLFNKDELVIKEGKKILGKLTLSKEEKEQVDTFLRMVSKKDDRHRGHVQNYKIVHLKNGKVVATVNAAVASALRKTSKEYLPLYKLRQRVEK